MSEDIIVRLIDLPICVRGVTVPHPDGTYNIYINLKYNADMQKDILRHELCHINYGDFDNFEDIKIVEDRANEYKNECTF